MHSVKVTFKDDCKHHQFTVADRQIFEEKETLTIWVIAGPDWVGMRAIRSKAKT